LAATPKTDEEKTKGNPHLVAFIEAIVVVVVANKTNIDQAAISPTAHALFMDS
jgi:hypothetical protein